MADSGRPADEAAMSVLLSSGSRNNERGGVQQPNFYN